MYIIIYSRMDLLEEYMKELGKDTHLDEFTMRDVQMKLPGTRHKWTGRLMRAKISTGRLNADKKKLVAELATKLIEQSPVKLSVPVARQKVQEHESVLNLNLEIQDNQIIIEFLEKVERIFNSMTFDIRNLTEIMKLETL